ncbi:hypothetical protein [Microbulbifer sediminum]|uniref:DUF7931 domain-containing protein n=1 Tax=Microbulbifer sediminum TaxID=2904250 RepID=UPI001F1A9235|nr:hypothetical protein [Microbulbifer sediminum]
MPDTDAQNPAAGPAAAGAKRQLQNQEDFREALVELLRGASRQVYIFSDRLARGIYSDPEVAEAISGFARRSRYVELQILVRDTDTLAREFNRTHNLAQRLSSRIRLRCVHPTAESPETEFVLADGRDVLLREDREQWRGVYVPGDRVRARKLGEIFQQQWERATEDPALRRLFL